MTSESPQALAVSACADGVAADRGAAPERRSLVHDYTQIFRIIDANQDDQISQVFPDFAYSPIIVVHHDDSSE